MPCELELTSLPTIQGCPGDDEIFFVANAIGGSGAGLYGWRRWRDIKTCITLTAKPPYIGVVDRGNPTDPVSGIPTFQDASLVGLGSSNNGDIQIVLDDVLLSTFGQNAGITFDPITGTVTNLTGDFQTGSGLFIDRNQ